LSGSSQLQATTPTTIKSDVLDKLLQGYPVLDRKYLVKCFLRGFKLKHHGPRVTSFVKNHCSALNNPTIVSDLIARELQLGKIAGPFSTPPFTDLVFSPLGLVPKKEANKYRLKHDLSFPRGASINNFISHNDSTVQFENLDNVTNLVKFCGFKALIAKCDIEEAFCQVPVHPSDYNLLGFTWKNEIYFDRCLPMGCASSCQIFECFSAAL